MRGRIHSAPQMEETGSPRNQGFRGAELETRLNKD